jgi:hypothetical protein
MLILFMPQYRNSFGQNLQFFIKHVLENKCDDVTFDNNILSTDKIKNLINKWNEVTKSNISYASLIRNFCNYNIKCNHNKSQSKFSYLFPPNFKLNEPFNRTKISVHKKSESKDAKKTKSEDAEKTKSEDAEKTKSEDAKKTKSEGVEKSKKLIFIKSIPIGIFQILKEKGGVNYAGFIKTVKLTPEEESSINNTEIIINLYDNGLIH